MKKYRLVALLIIAFIPLICIYEDVKNSIEIVYNTQQSNKPVVHKERYNLKKVKLRKVDSSAFSHVGYYKGHMVVVFRNEQDRCYIYCDFDEEEFTRFITSESLGKYYNNHIKGNYTVLRVDGIEISGTSIDYDMVSTRFTNIVE